ncbi:MAG TPA: hypothetical protein VKX96_04025 [Chloroflexota bacterium]|nr:hypothetical protein [Chloroflexota bacterium]
MITPPKSRSMVAASGDSVEEKGNDRRFLVILAICLLFVTSLPYVYGYLSSPPDKAYMGLDYAVYDYSQYMSWARDSATQILVANKLTPEANPPVFFNLLWWIIGRIDAYTGLSFVVANQLLRLISDLLFLVVANWFCGLVFPKRGQRRFALVLTCLTSGFGWLLVVLKHFTGNLLNPTDLYTPVGNSFFGFMSVPHHIISAAILIAIFALALQGYRHRTWHPWALAGLLGLILGMEHTYDLVTAYAVLGTFGVLMFLREGRWQRWLVSLALFYGISVPSVIYWTLLSRLSPQWQEVLAQYKNLGVFTPDPVQLIILLGPTFLLALATFRGFVPLAERRDDEIFLNGWFVVVLFIIYLPVNFQIMMLNGFQVALACLATRGLFDHVLPWLNRRIEELAQNPGTDSALVPHHPALNSLNRTLPLPSPDGVLPRTDVVATWLSPARLGTTVPALFLLAAMLTNLYIFGWRFVDIHRHTYPYYLSQGDVAALNWLDGHVQPSDVVLSSLMIGIYLPGWTGAHAFLAHGAETLDFNQKRLDVQRFFDPATPDQQRLATLQQFHVRYVFYGPAERQLGSYDPARAEYLKQVLNVGGTEVFEVNPAALAEARLPHP